ncbi:MAG TPA: type II secretion system secretin GspD [Sphingomonadaceae bacterium]|nr:type II secretion system secretin GspD [Sphingomonadaceae bacterium]
MKRFLVGFAALALASTSLSAQQVLNFRDADIRAFIQDASRVTGRAFVIDSRVQGKISVFTDRPLNRSEYFEVFLSTLRANGYIAVPTSGGAYRIQPIANAASQPTRIGTRRAANNQVVTEVFRLRNIEAAAATETLRPLISPEGALTANRNGNSLVVVDFADNVRRIRQLIGQIDRRGADSSASRVIPLRNAGAREIAEALTALGTTGPEGSRVTVVPIDSSNSVALRGSASEIARFAAIIADLDARAASGTEIRVIFLENADAERLVPVLQELVGQARSTTVSSESGSTGFQGGSGDRARGGTSNSRIVPPAPPAPQQTQVTSTGGGSGGGGRGNTIITRYEGANAVIISGSADIQRTLGEVVRQLDTRQAQVLVEAIIVEISDQAAQRLGVQLLLAGQPGSGLPFIGTNYSNAQPNILQIGAAVAARELNTQTTIINGNSVTTTTNSGVSDSLAQGAIQSVLGATGGLAGFAANLGSNAIFGTIINAVRSDTRSNLLSTPSIVTLDNQEARILVGQEVPIATGEALSPNLDNTFRTVQRQNVGITLEVKPQINAGGAVKLTLRQEVSSIAGPVSNNNSDLILNKRELQTTVIVDDGDIYALGGLLDDNERRTIEKIPFLGDLPGIGALFRSKAKSRAKTNLMVFIRPTILRTAAEARRLAQQRYGYARDMQWNNNPGVEPTLDELVRDYMGAVPPVAQQPGDIVIQPTPLPPSQVPQQ